jgi:hypothetical protein
MSETQAGPKRAYSEHGRILPGQVVRVTWTDAPPEIGTLLGVPQDVGDTFRVRIGAVVKLINPSSSAFRTLEVDA